MILITRSEIRFSRAPNLELLIFYMCQTLCHSVGPTQTRTYHTYIQSQCLYYINLLRERFITYDGLCIHIFEKYASHNFGYICKPHGAHSILNIKAIRLLNKSAPYLCVYVSLYFQLKLKREAEHFKETIYDAEVWHNSVQTADNFFFFSEASTSLWIRLSWMCFGNWV